MGLDDLFKNIDDVEKEIKVQYAELGKKLFEEKIDSAKDLFPDIAQKIISNKDRIVDFKKQINVIKGIVICEKCGAEVKNTYTFCQECGHKIKEAIEAAPAGFILCETCNTANESSAKFCKCCGSRLGAPVGSTSKTVVEPVKMEIEKVAPVETLNFKTYTPANEVASEKEDIKEKAEEKVDTPKVTAAPAKPFFTDIVGDRKCPQCGEPLNEDDTFCISCGAVFSVPTLDFDEESVAATKETAVETAPIEDGKECPKCGNKLGKYDTTCSRCGNKIMY